jgi:hypothetical protein
MTLFKYDPKKDVTACPAEKELTYRFTGFEKGKNIRKYFLDIMTCRACQLNGSVIPGGETRTA